VSFFSKFFYSEVIRVVDGNAVSVKGRHSRRLLGDVEDVCRDFGVSSGEIFLSGNGRVAFSDHLPKSVHQPLRNVMVAQG
jgi:hypothetical protein